MKKHTKKAILGSGITLAMATAAGGAAYLLSKKLIEIALDRELPKTIPSSKKVLIGSAEDAQTLVSLAEQAATQLEDSGCQYVSITGHDGIHLAGHWQENPSAKRIVVAMHGWRSSWCQDFGLIAPFFQNHECSVLYAEQRGQGSSGGDFMTFGLLERYDCLDWIRWVNEHNPKGLPVYLAGISMGASTVLMAAGLELPQNVRGIIADCGFTSPYDIWKHVAEENLHLSYELHDNLVERLCQKKISMGSQSYSTLEAMAVCKVPVLFVHGTDDTFVPISMTYENYQACTAPKELLVIPGAGHGLSYYVDQPRYEHAVMQFWNKYDS